MKKETTYGLIGVGVGILLWIGGLSAVGGFAEWKVLKDKFKRMVGMTAGSTDDSPIIVAGGSMTIHSKAGWVDDPLYPTDASPSNILSSNSNNIKPQAGLKFDFSTVNFRHVRDFNTPATSVPQVANLPNGWKLFLCVRQPDGTDDKPKDVKKLSDCDGFEIVVNADNDNTVNVLPLMNGNSGFKSPFLDKKFPEHSKDPGLAARRFEYNGCDVSGGQFCEHIGYIQVQDNLGNLQKELLCFEGECKVFIGGVPPDGQ